MGVSRVKVCKKHGKKTPSGTEPGLFWCRKCHAEDAERRKKEIAKIETSDPPELLSVPATAHPKRRKGLPLTHESYFNKRS